MVSINAHRSDIIAADITVLAAVERLAPPGHAARRGPQAQFMPAVQAAGGVMMG